jgi:hypothetical protein
LYVRFVVRVSMSYSVTVPSAMLLVQARRPSRWAVTMCDPRPLVAMVVSMRPVMKSTRSNRCDDSLVTRIFVPDCTNTAPCGRRYSPRSIERATYGVSA